MKFIGTLTLLVLSSFYIAFIILKVISWYKIPVHLDFKAIYGLVQIYELLAFKAIDLRDTNKDSEKDQIILFLTKYVVITILFLIIYIISIIL